MSNGMEFRGGAPAHPGRHRRGGAESWTPPLPQHRPPRRHAAGPPVDPPVSGSLPLPQPSAPRPAAVLPQPSLPQPRDRRPAPPLFPAAHGSLPLHDGFDDGLADDFDDDLDDAGLEPGPAEPPGPESRAEQAARRTRVSLATPKPRGADQEDDDVRVYAVPPIDGLGGFTIGSVPASVTPPKTWRKAAWFATGASGAVVVGLLFAGSFLVGKPPMDQAVQGAWPGYQGAPTVDEPVTGGDRQQPTSRPGTSDAGTESTRPEDDATGPSSGGGGAGPVDGTVPTPPGHTSGSPGSTTSGDTATTSGLPQKPPVTSAERETPVKAPWWYSFPPDVQTLGDNSEKFFNTVTTDPGTASSVTTGDLHDQGPHALAERYAGIAYFEVKKVSIDQERGVTVNTVEVTHTDGTKTIEERTLTFGDGDKIASDGR
jgi:hypothetical protein